MKERNKSVRKLLRLIIMAVLLCIPISISVSADTYISESEPNDRRVDANEITFPDKKETIIVNGNVEGGTKSSGWKGYDFFKLVIPKDCVLDFKIEYSADGEEGWHSHLVQKLWAGLCSEQDATHIEDNNFTQPICGGDAKGEHIYTYYMPAGIYYYAVETTAQPYTYIMTFDYRPVNLTNSVDSEYPSFENMGQGVYHSSWETAWRYSLGEELVGMKLDVPLWGIGSTYYAFDIDEVGEYILTFESGDGNDWYPTYNGEYAGYRLRHQEQEINDHSFVDELYFEEDYLAKGKIHKIKFKTTGTFYLDIYGPNLYRFRIEKKSDYDARNNSGTPTENETSNTNKTSSTNKIVSVNQPVSLTKDVTKPKKVTSLEVKNIKGKKAKLSWKRMKGVHGYQVKYALNKKFTKGKKTKLSNGNSTTIKKLTMKKTYYFRVRAYKVSGKRKVYGAWSKVRKVKIKK